MKIAVAGLGYVGLSGAILLAQHNKVVAVDINEARVAMVNAQKSPIVDPDIGITWPLAEAAILSDKDRDAAPLSALDTPFTYEARP